MERVVSSFCQASEKSTLSDSGHHPAPGTGQGHRSPRQQQSSSHRSPIMHCETPAGGPERGSMAGFLFRQKGLWVFGYGEDLGLINGEMAWVPFGLIIIGSK